MQKIEHFSFRPIPEQEQTDLISVIVAVYNIEAYLEKCVRSIRDQDNALLDQKFDETARAIADGIAGTLWTW